MKTSRNANLLPGEPDGRRRVEIDRAQLDVSDPAALERFGRPFAAPGRLLRAHRAVVLVLHLEEVRVELPIRAARGAPRGPPTAGAGW